jgi:hypothetical protein
MARFHSSRPYGFSDAWKQRIVDKQPSLPLHQEPQPDLTVHQQYALLVLRQAGTESLAARVLTTMGAMGADFTDADLGELVRRGYAKATERHGTLDNPFGSHRGHAITPTGVMKAQLVALDLAHKYGIHHVTFHAPAPRSKMGPRVSCTCFWRQHADRRNGHRLHALAAQHMREVAAGTYKEPRSVADIFDATFGKSSSSSSRATASLLPPCPDAAAPESGAVRPDVRLTAPPDLEARDG